MYRVCQGQQQMAEVRSQALDIRVAEGLPAVIELQPQSLPDAQQHRQRIVGLFQILHWAKLQPRRRALLQGFGHRVVLEHQDAVKQRLAA